MSAVTTEAVEAASIFEDVDAAPIDPRTLQLLQDPILPMLIRLAWPNILIMLAQASTGLIETWWVSHMGTAALAGMALVFPAVMLMQMMSAGGFGGAISSAIARALGSGRRDEADLLAWHAVVVNVALGLLFSAIMLAYGRPIYQALGGEGPELEAALIYSNVVFSSMIFVWLMNGLASVVRGTGNMLFPALVTCVGAALLVPVSPLLIFGFGPFQGSALPAVVWPWCSTASAAPRFSPGISPPAAISCASASVRFAGRCSGTSSVSEPPQQSIPCSPM